MSYLLGECRHLYDQDSVHHAPAREIVRDMLTMFLTAVRGLTRDSVTSLAGMQFQLHTGLPEHRRACFRCRFDVTAPFHARIEMRRDPFGKWTVSSSQLDEVSLEAAVGPRRRIDGVAVVYDDPGVEEEVARARREALDRRAASARLRQSLAASPQITTSPPAEYHRPEGTERRLEID